MNFFWGESSDRKSDAQGDDLLQSTSTFDLLSLPTSEAGAFYDQLNKEIEGLREKVDSQLRDMVEASRKDITVLESKLRDIQSTESSSVMTPSTFSSFTTEVKSTLHNADSNVTEPVANLSGRPKSRARDSALSPSQEAKLLGVLRIGTVEECREDDENDETAAGHNADSQDRILQTRTRPDQNEVPVSSSSMGHHQPTMPWKSPSTDGLVLMDDDDNEDPWKKEPTMAKHKPSSDAIDKARNARKTPTATFLGHVNNRNNPFDSSSNDDSTPEGSDDSDAIDLIEKSKETTAVESEALNSIRNRPSLIDADSEDVEDSVDERERAKKSPKEAIAGSFFSPHIVTLTESVEDIVLRKRQSPDPHNEKTIIDKPADIERVDHAAINGTKDSEQRGIVQVEGEQATSPINLTWFYPSEKSTKEENIRPKNVPLTQATTPALRHEVQCHARDPPIDKKKVPSNPYYAARFHVPSDPSESGRASEQEREIIENMRSQSLTPSAMAVSPFSEMVEAETARPESAPPIASSISISRIGHSFVSDEESNLPPNEDPYYEGRSEALRRKRTRGRATTSKSPEKYKYMTQTPSYDEAYDEGVDPAQELHGKSLVSEHLSQQRKGQSKHDKIRRGDDNPENYVKKQGYSSNEKLYSHTDYGNHHESSHSYSEWDYHDYVPEDQHARSTSRRKPRSYSNHDVYTNQSHDEEYQRNLHRQKAASKKNHVPWTRDSFDRESGEEGLYRQRSEGSGPRRRFPVATSYEEDASSNSYDDEYENCTPKLEKDRSRSIRKSQREHEVRGNRSHDQEYLDNGEYYTSYDQDEYIQRRGVSTSRQKSRDKSHHALNEGNSHNGEHHEDYFRSRSRENNSSSWDDQDDRFDARITEQQQRKKSQRHHSYSQDENDPQEAYGRKSQMGTENSKHPYESQHHERTKVSQLKENVDVEENDEGQHKNRESSRTKSKYSHPADPDDPRLRSESSRRSKSTSKHRKSDSNEQKSKRSQSARQSRGNHKEGETLAKTSFDEIYVQRHDLVTGEKHGQSAHSRSRSSRKSTSGRSRTRNEVKHSSNRESSQNQVQHTISRDLSHNSRDLSQYQDIEMSRSNGGTASHHQGDRARMVRDTPASNDDDYNTEISSALVEWSPPKESPPNTKASKIKRRQPSPERLMRTRMVLVDHGAKSPPESQQVFFQPSPEAGEVQRIKEKSKNKKKSKNKGLSVETSHPSSFSTAIVPHVGSEVVAVPKAKQPIPVTSGTSTDLVAIQKTIQNGQMVILSEVQGKLVKDPYGDEGRYTGIMLEGLPHGEGTMHYSDGRSYTGEWRNGRWHGQGRATFVNGDVFSGKYERDRRHGKGRYEWADGRVYDGEFVRNQRHGHGAYTWPDGASYIGEFVDGQRHGEGCYRFADGSVYKGEWQNGKYDGIGECVWASGRKYHGEWRAGKAQGYGVEFRSNGTIRHQGEWKKDRPVRRKVDP